MILDCLEPKEVFYYFEELSRIPHGSGNTQAISNYCVDFAKKKGLRYNQDELNNVIIFKPATSGLEEAPTIIIQGHMDMVCAKDDSCNKDFQTEGLDLFIEGNYIGAHNTSLGGDDGIAIAMGLALLASDTIAHPNMEVVFTVDEETGMSGAKGLDTNLLHGKLMLNLDSEEEGVFTVACAGGARVQNCFEICTEPYNCIPLQISITGLIGGHSGTEICNGRENANALMVSLLSKLQCFQSLRIISLNGGEADNAIPNSCYSRISISSQELDDFLINLEKEERIIIQAILSREPSVKITHSYDSEQQTIAFTRLFTEKIITALIGFPNGVQKMSNNIKGLPETSLNFGMLETHNNMVLATFSVRSSNSKEKERLINTLCNITNKHGGISNISGDYPAWEYLPSSTLQPRMYNTFVELFDTEPSIVEIHAGLECGILAEKIEGLDCVSFGPDIQNIHTSRERLNISSVLRTWTFIKALLAQKE